VGHFSTAKWVTFQRPHIWSFSQSGSFFDGQKGHFYIDKNSSEPRQVGLRLMIDTLIGANDGVPFVVPGHSGIVDQAVTLISSDIPDFIQAIEQADLVNPGVIVHLTLRGGDATPPDRVDLAGWYHPDADWDIITPVGGVGTPLYREGDPWTVPDSTVALYYNPLTLNPGESRSIVTFYGLGGISSTSSGNATLSLAFARQVTVGDSFWIVAMVVNPTDGQTLQLTLPEGLTLIDGHTTEKPVTFSPGDHYTQISWLARAEQNMVDGVVQVTLLPDAVSEQQTITVTSRGVTR
jgi:hypothetical protein